MYIINNFWCFDVGVENKNSIQYCGKTVITCSGNFGHSTSSRGIVALAWLKYIYTNFAVIQVWTPVFVCLKNELNQHYDQPRTGHPVPPAILKIAVAYKLHKFILVKLWVQTRKGFFSTVSFTFLGCWGNCRATILYQKFFRNKFGAELFVFFSRMC